MAISKVLIASILLCLLLLSLAEAADQTESTKVAGSSDSGKIDCDAACAARCQLASRQRLCHRACGTCCARCSCVPSGTSGNTDVCPCYATMTTHGGRLKCP
ncbi:snakin-2-like [Syzygium oleosum]|uniref:snakin-2-like n=1 Tax=Syzygium oleosum TaxID=219896 RepID=UPI0011D1CB9E|nr:snakin-2-like [Syzygium oleosum]